MAAIDDPLNARSRRTRQALLSAARDVIESEGVGALTMAAVAEGAGVSRRAAYLHFASRGELVTSLYQHLGQTEDLGTSLQAVWDSPDATTALTEWARHIARAHPRIRAVAQAVEGARREDADAAVMWQAAMGNWLRGCTRLAQWLDRDGVLHPAWCVRSTADMLWGLMSWDLLERMTVDRGWDEHEFGERLAELLQATFVNPSLIARASAY